MVVRRRSYSVDEIQFVVEWNGYLMVVRRHGYSVDGIFVGGGIDGVIQWFDDWVGG